MFVLESEANCTIVSANLLPFGDCLDKIFIFRRKKAKNRKNKTLNVDFNEQTCQTDLSVTN